MGQCYEHEQIRSKAGAIRCFRRAVDSGDREGRTTKVLHSSQLRGLQACVILLAVIVSIYTFSRRTDGQGTATAANMG